MPHRNLPARTLTTPETSDHHELTGGPLTILPPGITAIGVAAEADTQRLAGLGAATVRVGEGWADRVKATAAPDGAHRVGREAAGAASAQCF